MTTPWLAQAAARFWRLLGPPSARRASQDAPPLSFPGTPAAAAAPKQRRGYADKMRRPGRDYADKAGSG